MFGETLRYASPQKPGTTERFDGNISEITYASYNGTSTPSTDTYGYAYDGLKRLTDAVHYAGAATTQSLLKTEKNITYDRDGNITGLNRYSAAGLSEMLSFTHAGNRLSSVQSWDGANLPQIGTFTYDAMGNQLTDSRKGLQFCYNFANLPSKVEGMSGSGNAGLTLNYGYLSDGTKTSAITETAAGSGAEGLKYRGAFVYELKDGAERLSTVAWSDGRTEYDYSADASSPDINDQWHISDHLGNVRAVVLMDYSGGTVLEQNEYLPFGTRLANPAFEQYSNRYRLGGKEEQRFGGLDLALSDFGARFYDPFTARWTTRDPLAGKYHSLSPYNYCAGNPVNLVDEKGSSVGKAAKTVYKVAKKAYKAAKNSEKFRLGVALAEEGYSLVDDAKTLANPEATTLQKGLAVLDLATGFGEEAKLGLKAVGVSESAFVRTSRSTLSKRMKTLNGGVKPEGKHAHHMLPWDQIENMEKAGLDVNDPKYGMWLDAHEHLSKSHEYDQAWKAFFKENSSPTASQILDEMKRLMLEIYGKEIM